jgi:redox-sensing transcriptional repressor
MTRQRWAEGTRPRGREESLVPDRRELSERQVARLSVYRRLLQTIPAGDRTTIYSHTLAELCRSTAAQVRRDLMTIGFTGSPARGYHVSQLVDAIGRFLDAPGGQRAALVGVGNLGRALLDYFTTWRPQLRIVAAFDVDPRRVNRVVLRCRVWSLEKLGEIVRRERITVGVITVPAEAAQSVADAMLDAGIRGFLNFAPTLLRLPPGAHVEEMDIGTSMEKVAYFARLHAGAAETGRRAPRSPAAAS